MYNNHFDYIIIGNGMAGLQLALALANDTFFDSKTIALIDKDTKSTNDKTWSFWEKGSSKWDDLVSKTWTKAFFNTSKQQIKLDLETYSYKSIRSIDFYNHAKNILETKTNFTFIIDSITTIVESTVSKIEGESKIYHANHIFDSRIPEAYFEKNNKYIKIHQHFKGWIIETDSDVFDPDSFTMMDYSIKYNNDTTFTYVLPFSKREALIEFTFFTPYTIEDFEYDHYLKKYISDILNIDEYSIKETEIGNIPMTNFPFHNYHTKSITKIGTAAGWVKGSTGYAFKHTEKKVKKIIQNIKQNKTPSIGLTNKKYLFYDKIFLNVLKTNNQKGEWIFNKFYSKNTIKNMLSFLDEESKLLDDISIMSSLFSFTFIKSFFRTLN